MAYLVLAALVFGVCFLVDKGFTKLFRNRQQHKSGMTVKHNKRAALFGLVLGVLGIAGILAGIGSALGLLILSAVVLLMAVALIVYYLSFGIYYDEKSFLVSSLGKQSAAHAYGDIREQKLYVVQGGSTIVELHMADGRAVGLQSTMEGTYPFLDHAFAAWCRQTGRNPEDCEFHDPSNSIWFPMEEA